MPLRNQLPAPLRYFKARLRPLARPPVWGTAIFISLVGLVAWQYGFNPELRDARQNNELAESNNPASPSLSREDSGIGADIDSLPVLSHDFDRSSVPVAPLTTNKNTQANKPNGLYDDLLAKKKAPTADNQSTAPKVTGTPAAPMPNLDNPLLVQAQNQLQAGPLNSGGTSLGIVVPSSPLATAINQSAIAQSANSGYANPSAIPTNSQFPTNALGQSLPTNALPSQTAPLTTGLPTGTSYTQPVGTNITPVPNLNPNSYTYSASSQPVPSVAPAVPVAPVAPSVASPVPTNIAPYSVQVPSQGSGTGTNPQFGSTFGNSALQPSALEQSSFPARRSIQQR